jgi:nicotinamidase-related amidase
VSDWKNAYRSFYYETAESPGDLELDPQRTALLVIDIQNTYMEVDADPVEAKRWAPFRERMNQSDGRDRSLSQKKPGFNYLLLPKDREDSQLVAELTPDAEDIVVLKTTDSALTGTNLRLLLRNMEISDVIVAGIFTDQCVSSTVRSLADESFGVVVVEDCCAAATDELHLNELKSINMIYCHVVQSEDIHEFLE